MGIQITTRPEIILSPVSKPCLAINKVSDRMTGMPEQITPASDQVEIEGAVENDKKETGEKNKEEVMEDATPQASKTDIADKGEEEDKAEKYTTKEEENDKNKEKDKVKGDNDDEKTKKGNKDDKAEKKRKEIFKKYICNI